MDSIKIGNREFVFNGINWAAQNELDKIWLDIASSWDEQENSNRRIDLNSDEAYKVMRLVYLPKDNGALLSMREFLQIKPEDGESCKKKYLESFNVSESSKRASATLSQFMRTTKPNNQEESQAQG